MEHLEQSCINKRSGRKQQDFAKAEADFQEAQASWAEDENNIKAWHKMFTLINIAVFNCINKKLEKILEKEEIEGRALDITCTIMSGLKKKRANRKDWKIGKVSSYVYLPCLAIYKKQLAFEDQVLDQTEYEPDESDLDNEDFHPIKIDWEYKQGYGYYE